MATEASSLRINTVNQLDATASIQASSLRALTVYNFPSDGVDASSLRANVVVKPSVSAEVSQLRIMSVNRGRIENPRLRAWTYTMDGHDFYILRLEDTNTLVYDLTTETWSRFTSGDLPFWRANTGMNWVDGTSLGYHYGSNVIVGDDVSGTLYFLDPDQGYDDSTAGPNTKRLFPRAATGQVVAKAREYLSCFEVWLNCSNGLPSMTDQTVDLKYSDDAGRNYVSAQPIVVEQGNYVQDIQWQSLGRFCYPGRLFRIEDDGALARIDGMDVNNGLSTS